MPYPFCPQLQKLGVKDWTRASFPQGGGRARGTKSTRGSGSGRCGEILGEISNSREEGGPGALMVPREGLRAPGASLLRHGLLGFPLEGALALGWSKRVFTVP